MMININSNVYVSPLQIVAIIDTADGLCEVCLCDGQRIESNKSMKEMVKLTDYAVEGLHPVCRA